jgi:hypothetical protein
MMSHPRLASMNYARPDDRRCTSCHSEEETWAFNHPSVKPTYESYSPAWVAYYETAWWYDKLWDYHPAVGKANTDKAKTRHNER